MHTDFHPADAAAAVAASLAPSSPAPEASAVTWLRVDALRESPFNARKRFDPATLAELATDIAEQGVLSPLLVRPIGGGHELVFGHRRLRAAVLAGLMDVPCMVRALSDAEARRAQISENLSRDDVHPIEEAEAFQALIDADGLTADAIAAQYGKSRSYVYGRLKLLQACPEIRQACLDGAVGSEVALLIARLRTAKLQAKALGYIKADYRADLADGGQASYRAIRDLLAEKFTLDLKGAMFDPQDATLLPLAGACHACPKRSGNAPEYADIAQSSKGRFDQVRAARPDACTDPECFDAKKQAHLAREAQALQGSGKVLVVGNAARNAISARGEIKGAYVALKDVQAALKKAGPKAKAGGGDAPAAPQVVLIQDPRTGKTHKAVKRADLADAGVAVKAPPASDRGNYAEQEKRYAAERAKREAAAAAEQARRVALLERITQAMAATPRSAFDLQLVARAAWAGVEYLGRELLAERHGAPTVEALTKQLGQMDVPALTVFLLECALANDVAVAPHDAKDEPRLLLQAAKHYGVG